MSEQLRESMSAAIDDEADAFELRRVLDEASVDDDLREEWHRMHLIRDLLQDEMCNYSPGLREAVWQGLLNDDQQDENTAELRSVETGSAEKNQANPWIGRITGVAVAVTAAVLVLINGGVLDEEPGLAINETYETPSTTVFAGAGNDPSGGSLAPVMYRQATDADLHRQYGFMMHHIQQRAMNQNGLASFVKMATFTQPGVADAATSSADENTVVNGSSIDSNSLNGLNKEERPDAQ